MEPKYIREDNQLPAKLFREDFYTTRIEFEIGVSEIIKERSAEEKDLPITTRQLKDKMHELLYNEGMSAFTTRKATAEGKRIFKEMHESFYGEMKELPLKKAAPKKEEDEKPAKAAKKADAKKETKAPAAATNKKSAGPKDFQEATNTGK